MANTEIVKRFALRSKKGKAYAGLVRFELNGVVAGTVCIAGTFNEWNPRTTEMMDLGNGRWMKEFSLRPGTYEYLYVIDGKWVEDLHAAEFVPNPFGGRNCVLRVPDRVWQGESWTNSKKS